MAQLGLPTATGGAPPPARGLTADSSVGGPLQVGGQDPFSTIQRTPDAAVITGCAKHYGIDGDALVALYKNGPPGGAPNSFSFPSKYGPNRSLGTGACGAARYLAALGGRSNLDHALSVYGHGDARWLAKVKAQTKREKGTGPILNPDAISIPNVVSTVVDAIIASVGWLGETENWVRIGEGVVGAVIVYLGLHALTGAGPSPSQLARAAGPGRVVSAARKAS